ncbi:MAG: HEAT repeat domain-containing protein, partial [Candidatus Wallbacteria bacterium]|nr:HEAT repeat domain-containing protein [Candidatus Wallbacteria bacterium]
MDEERREDVGLLLARLRKPASAGLKAALVKAIGYLGTREHADLLGWFSADSDDEVRFAAQEAVELLSGVRPVGKRKKRPVNDPDATAAVPAPVSRPAAAPAPIAKPPAPPRPSASRPVAPGVPPPAPPPKSTIPWDAFLETPKASEAPPELSTPLDAKPLPPESLPVPKPAPKPAPRRASALRRPPCSVCGEQPPPSAVLECPSCGERLPPAKLR